MDTGNKILFALIIILLIVQNIFIFRKMKYYDRHIKEVYKTYIREDGNLEGYMACGMKRTFFRKSYAVILVTDTKFNIIRCEYDRKDNIHSKFIETNKYNGYNIFNMDINIVDEKYRDSFKNTIDIIKNMKDKEQNDEK